MHSLGTKLAVGELFVDVGEDKGARLESEPKAWPDRPFRRLGSGWEPLGTVVLEPGSIGNDSLPATGTRE